MKLYAEIIGIKLIDGKLIPVSKGQGSNQSLAIEIKADNLQGIPTRANVFRLSLNVGNDNELEAELLDYSTGKKTNLIEGKQQKGECAHNNTEWRDEHGKSYLNCFDCNEVLRIKEAP